MRNQALKKKVNELLKTIFYLPHYASLLSEANFKIHHPHSSNCVCSNALFCLKNNIFEFFSTQIFAMKVDESIKTIFSLTQYASLSKQAHLKTGHTQLSKLCLLKRAVLFKEKRVFESSNIRNEHQKLNKSHFLSCETYLPIY